jgi:hypothetical protein
MVGKRAINSMQLADQKQSFVGIRVAICVAGFALAGCSSGAGLFGGGTSSWFPSLPGFSSVSSTNNAGTALAAAPSVSMEDNCPTVDVRTGTGTLAVANKPQALTANDLRYQVTVVELARQCVLVDNVIRMRVGVQARAVAGPAGAHTHAGTGGRIESAISAVT